MVNSKDMFLIVRVILILLIGVFMHIGVQAQSNTSEPNELDIKTSGNYYWEQLSGDNEEKIKNQIIELIWNNEGVKKLVSENKNFTKEQIGFITKPRGKTFLIIGYLSKETNRSLSVQPIQRRDSVTSINTQPNQLLYSKDDYLTNIQTDSSQQKFNTNEVLPASEPSEEMHTNNSQLKLKAVSSDLVKKLLDQKKCAELVKILESEKKKGKAYYSPMDNVFDNGLESCYVMICDTKTGELRYLLDKGGNRRIDFLTENIIYLEDISKLNTLKKLYIYEIK